MEKSQAESCVCGVGPAESTGKPRSRYCPGGSLPLVSLCWRRPRNPREKNPSLIVSPPVLLSLCSYCALVYHAQTFSVSRHVAQDGPFLSCFSLESPGSLLERLVGEQMLSLPPGNHLVITRGARR